MRKSITLLLFFTAVFAAAQQDYRTWLRGKVLYQDSSVVAANILNTNSENATITDDNGELPLRLSSAMNSLYHLFNMKFVHHHHQGHLTTQSFGGGCK